MPSLLEIPWHTVKLRRESQRVELEASHRGSRPQPVQEHQCVQAAVEEHPVNEWTQERVKVEPSLPCLESESGEGWKDSFGTKCSLPERS